MSYTHIFSLSSSKVLVLAHVGVVVLALFLCSSQRYFILSAVTLQNEPALASVEDLEN